MSTVLMLVLLWGAAIYRIAFTARHPLTVWRAAFTVGTTMTAVSATFWVYRAAIDRLTGVANLANLLCHIALLAGVVSGLVYIESLRHRQLPRRQVGLHLGVGALTALVMVLTWVAAPIHGRFYPDLAPLAGNLSITLYSAAFYVFLVWSLGRIAAFCLIQGFRREDPARTVSLILTGLSCALGALISAIWAAAIAVRYAAGSDSTKVSRAGDALLPVALITSGAAILALLIVPWVLDVVRSYLRLRALRPAWRVLTNLHPEVRLRPTRAWGLRAWLEMRERRTAIELDDALRLRRLQQGLVADYEDLDAAVQMLTEGRQPDRRDGNAERR
jgi:hypothetical protein